MSSQCPDIFTCHFSGTNLSDKSLFNDVTSRHAVVNMPSANLQASNNTRQWSQSPSNNLIIDSIILSREGPL